MVDDQSPHTAAVVLRGRMRWVLIYELVDDYLERRAALRDDHLTLARAAHERGELLLAGALADPYDRALLVFAGDGPAAAEAFAAADPYVTARSGGVVDGAPVERGAGGRLTASPTVRPGVARFTGAHGRRGAHLHPPAAPHPGGHQRRPVHDLPRRHDRERGPARHPEGLRRRRAGPAVGGGGLQPHDGHVHHVGGDAGRPARPPEGRTSAGMVHLLRGVGRVRGGPEPVRPEPRPRPAGRGCGHGERRLAGARERRLPRTRRRKARAIGIWTGIAAVGLAIGPTVGGFLTETAGWRVIFLVNVGVGAVGVLLARAFVDESTDPTQRRFDLPGSAPVHRRRRHAHLRAHRGTAHRLALAAHPRPAGRRRACWSSAFVLAELHSPDPMMDVRVFHDRVYSAAIFTLFAILFSVYGMLLVITQYFQNVRDYSPERAGVLMLAFTVPTIILSPISGGIAARVGGRTTDAARHVAARRSASSSIVDRRRAARRRRPARPRCSSAPPAAWRWRPRPTSPCRRSRPTGPAWRRAS